MTRPVQIVFLIDLQNGFARKDLSSAQGGSLYVPDGEKAIAPAARLVAGVQDAIIVLSQDYHPENHISFADNHQGVNPFVDVYLRKSNGKTSVVAADIGGKIFAVTTDAAGRVTAVLPEEVPVGQVADCLKQKLWFRHCVRGTESALFCDELLNALPAPLVAKLRAAGCELTLHARDDRNNHFHVVRKGTTPDLDSYGIATENDLKSKTQAGKVFAAIIADLKKRQVQEVVISVGGLATNFCTEFSHNDIVQEFVPLLQAAGIKARVQLLTDISYGIPISVPDGSWPDLTAAPARMARQGTGTATTADVMAATQTGWKQKARDFFFG